MEYDEIKINLNILSKLEINQKLITRDTYLNIETNSLIPEWFRRWNRQENRNETLRKINIIINESSKHINEKNNEELKEYLKSSIKGLNNLKETYSTCNQTTSRIEIIINTINNILSD